MTMTSIFDHIDDDAIIKEILSFCEFRSVARVGQTCRRLRGLSDTTLDDMAVSAIANLPHECEWSSSDGGSSIYGTLERGWKTDYRSKASLINAAVGECFIPEEDGDFDEDRARYILRTRGAVDIKDFIDNDDGYADEMGWNVRIRYGQMTRSSAARYAERCTREIKYGDGDPFCDCSDSDEEDDNEGCNKQEIVRTIHSVLCLLRKADPSSLVFSHMNVEHRHTDYPRGSKTSCILMAIPGGNDDNGNAKEIEFRYENSYQAL